MIPALSNFGSAATPGTESASSSTRVHMRHANRGVCMCVFVLKAVFNIHRYGVARNRLECDMMHAHTSDCNAHRQAIAPSIHRCLDQTRLPATTLLGRGRRPVARKWRPPALPWAAWFRAGTPRPVCGEEERDTEWLTARVGIQL